MLSCRVTQVISYSSSISSFLSGKSEICKNFCVETFDGIFFFPINQSHFSSGNSFFPFKNLCHREHSNHNHKYVARVVQCTYNQAKCQTKYSLVNFSFENIKFIYDLMNSRKLVQKLCFQYEQDEEKKIENSNHECL